MADNVTLSSGSGGAVVAADDVSSVFYQRVKLDGGGDGAATPILAGGGVEASAIRVTVASDSTGVLSVDDNGSTLSVDDGASSLTVDNGGTFAVQESGNALTALQLLDNTIIVDDAAFTPAVTSVNMAGFMADETATDSVTEGDAGAARITLDRKLIVTDQPHTAGGCSVYTALSTAAVLSAAIKASAGNLYTLELHNTNGANEVFVRLYNMSSAPANTDTPVWRGVLPGAAAGTVHQWSWPKGIEFTTGIGIRVTGAVADNDATALAANEILVGATYK